MSLVRRAVWIGALAGLATACGSDSTGSNLPEVVGTWNATKFEFVSTANSSVKADLIALGASAVVVFTSSHTFTSTATLPGQQAKVASGTWTETATSLTVTVTSQIPTQVSTFTLVLSGNTLLLTGGATTFDFGGGDVPAVLNLTLTRQ